MSHYATGDLWTSEDQLPSCDPCLDGNHNTCPDLFEIPRYGLIACGCGNPAHKEDS